MKNNIFNILAVFLLLGTLLFGQNSAYEQIYFPKGGSNLGTSTGKALSRTPVPTGEVKYLRLNLDGTATQLTAAQFLSAIGGGSSSFAGLTGNYTDNASLVSGFGLKVDKTTTVNTQPLSGNITITPTSLGLLIGTNTQAWSANLDAWSAIAPSTKQNTLNNSAGLRTALSDETGGGSAVFDTDPLLKYTWPAMSGTTVNITRPGEAYAATGNVTVDVSSAMAAASAGQSYVLYVTADGAPRTISFTSCFSLNKGASRSSVTVPASGQLAVVFKKLASSVVIIGGDPVNIADFTEDTTPDPAANVEAQNPDGSYVKVSVANLSSGGAAMAVGTYFGWSTADIAGRPANSLVADGTNGTLNLGTIATGGSWVVMGNGTVATPTVDIPAGTYGSTQNVTISDATSGSTIRYTLTGVDPTTSDTTYSTPVAISSSATLKAKAWKDLYAASSVFSAAYVISGASYLISEGFEGAGLPTNWTAVASPDWDSTSGPLLGAQSMVSSDAGGKGYASFSAQTDIWTRFMISADSFASSPILHELRDSSGVEQLYFRVLADGRIRLMNGAYTEAGTGSTTLTINTAYYVWIRYVAGSGSNAAYTVYVSATSTRPGSAELTITNGTSTGSIARWYSAPLGNGAVTKFDNVLVSASEIGSGTLP